MKKHKKDLIYLSIIILSFLVLSFYVVGKTYLFGSMTDWYAQHISIPEYFRTLFYSTKDLLPDFALNIGNGQNIYNFSYYGLLSPYVLISYLLPMFNMCGILIVLTIISVIVSTILMYNFLKKHNFSEEVSFLATLCFTLSAPIVFHVHRHLMFINYMPFLIMGLYGVDKRFNSHKSWLLTLSVFLMVMTSYYYSIGGIACLFVYALYVYLQKNKVITIKTFFRTLFSIMGPVIIAICMSSIITIPTLLAMFNNRLDSNVKINLLELLLPLPSNFKNLIYGTYGLGLPFLIVPALINNYKKDKANLTLSIILTLLFILNIFNYILNGTMYIDSKSLIPFLPIYIYVIAIFVNDLFNHKLNYKTVIPSTILISIYILLSNSLRLHYFLEICFLFILLLLFHKIPKKRIIIIPLFFLILGNAYNTSKGDNLVLKYETENNDTIITDSLNTITTSDDSFYRTSVDVDDGTYPNKIFNNINYYNSTIYSSISNTEYNKFFYDVTNNNIAHRNRAMTTTTPNLINLMFSSNKYIISYKKALQGYELVSTNNGLNIYRNNNVMTLGVATSNTMSYEDYEQLNMASSSEALLGTIITDEESNNNFVSNAIKSDLTFVDLLDNEEATFNEDGSVSLKVNKRLKVTYTLPEEYQNKIMFIKFKMNKPATKNDTSITINGIKNKLTISDWKYYNGNDTFKYIIGFQDLKDLNIIFSKGEYNLSDLEIYFLDYSYLEQSVKSFDKFIVDTNETKGDKVVGDISVTNNGYFMLSLPYSSGFTIKVDGVKTDYEKVDYSFIGFKINEGSHHIEVEYHAPGKTIAIIISILGLISYIAVIIVENKRKI